MKTKWLACLVAVLGACPSVTVDTNEGTLGPTVEFDPANKIIPFPNNLLLDPATGKVSLPEQCNESATTKLTRTGVLNKLDGFGTYETAINVTFTEPVDPASLAGNVLVFERVHAGTAVESPAPLPVAFIPGKTIRFTDQTNLAACTGPKQIDQVTIVPLVPLDQRSTYTVAVLDGVKTANGAAFNPSFTWSLVREPEPVVVFDAAGNVTTNQTPLDPLKSADLAQLHGIDLLWKAHNGAVSFLTDLGHPSAQLVLAFEFNTQTTTDPLDATVDGTPAAGVVTTVPLLGNTSNVSAVVTNHLGPFAPCGTDTPVPNDNECFLRVLLGGGNPDINLNYAIGKQTCAAAGCPAISDTLSSLLLSKQYQTDIANTTYAGTGTFAIPGAWGDPIKPAVVHDTDNPPNPAVYDPAHIGVLVLIPQGPVPANGFPTVIFQHGITRSKGDVFGVAGALTSNGFAVVAIDAPNHGTRAIRISNAANAVQELDCTDVTNQPLGPRLDHGPDPTSHASCYAPPFSADLAASRDGFRQTVVDLQQLVAALKACGTTACGKLKVDATKIAYVGHSMIGGNLGGIALGTGAIKAGVINVSGAGWLDILENTKQVVTFQCPLVDALIDAGALTCNGAPCTAADKFNPIANTGLCLTDAWKTDPGYIQFSVIGRWVLDPADPANFGTQLSTKRFLLQEVVDDDVVPNLATENEAELVGQLRADASCNTPNPSPPPAFIPSTALLAAPTQSHFLDYLTVAPGTPGCVPGNTFSHGALLKPEAGAAGQLGTARLQTDMVFFLLSNQ